ncbi:MAG: glycosyltransferase [Pseudomonadota bacterium]
MSHLHVVLIGWEGQAASTRALAEALAPHAPQLSVIYSNLEDTSEDGPGSWIRVPQSWYFGRKFARSLECLAPGDIMLQIQADVAHDRWDALVEHCAGAFEQHDRMGIWGPDLDWTPWPTQRVQNGPPISDGLVPVQQTDGVVWALHPEVSKQLAHLDYTQANLGWGIDWVALNIARRLGRRTVRDLRHQVHHPSSRGYSGATATQHMKNLLAQLPSEQRVEILALHDALHAVTAAPPEQDPPNTSVPASPLSSSFGKFPKMLRKSAQSSLTSASLYDGAVYVATAKPAPDLILRVAPATVGFEPLDGPPPGEVVPVQVPVQETGPEGVAFKLGGLGEWQVSGWQTLRVIPQDVGAGAFIPVSDPIPLVPGTGEVELSAHLACHRARGRLVATVTTAKGVTRHLEQAFNPGFAGGNSPNGYQVAQLALGQIRETCSVTLSVAHDAALSGTNEPPVYFVATPTVKTRVPGRQIAPVSFVLGEGDAACWYRAELSSDMQRSLSPMVLENGAARAELFHPAGAEVTCTEDWGHAFQFRSSTAFAAMVYVNGKAAFATHISEGATYLHLPQPQLTGRHSWMEIRDPSGTHVYWSNWILPRWQVTPISVLQAEGRGPYPAELFHQSPYRFRALREQITRGGAPDLLAQLPQAIEALEAGFDRLSLKPLHFPEIDTPDASIVIPAHNKVKVTYACLAALLLAPNKASFEVILVDDASTDETAEIEKLVSGITVVRNSEAQRFIRACNAGVEAAQGRYVVLLNNDTEPTVGWLDALIEAFERFDNVGLVGSKLLYPDGQLQDAGGIIWGSGDPWNYGNRQNPWDPRFCYARQADYLSGAAMMTTRGIWDEVGGLSAYLEPMYFEDTDFSFKVREAGYTTWFVPSSIVYHYEGLTSGTDTSSGFKRFQEVNRPKFKRRWAKDFAGFTKTPRLELADMEKDRGIVGRVLFIDYTTPTPDMDAGSYAALQEIKLVQSLGYKVTFLPENLAYFGSYTEELGAMGVEVIYAPFYQNIDAFFKARGREFDAFYVTRYHVANANVPRIRAINPEARILMNNADLHYLRLLRKAVAEGEEDQKAAAREVQKEEFSAMASVDLVLSYNDKEHAIIEAQSEGAIKVMPCPWVQTLSPDVAPLKGRKGLSFLGGFRHHPNVEGVEWFARNVMNRIEAQRPDIALTIYGSRMGDRIKKLASPVIEPVGFVEDVSEAYGRHRVFVAPLLSGAGIKGKVLAALAHGIPCVLSPMAAEGIGLRHGQDCMIATTGTEWLQGITTLYDDDAAWSEMSEAGRKLIATQFSFDRGREQMRTAFEAVEIFAHCG